MSIILQPKTHCLAMGATQLYHVHLDPAAVLATGESFTGTPTVEEVGTSGVTIDEVAITTVDLDDDGNTVLAGRAIQFRAYAGSGVTASATPRKFKVTLPTDGSPSQNIIRQVWLTIVDPDA